MPLININSSWSCEKNSKEIVILTYKLIKLSSLYLFNTTLATMMKSQRDAQLPKANCLCMPIILGFPWRMRALSRSLNSFISPASVALSFSLYYFPPRILSSRLGISLSAAINHDTTEARYAVVEDAAAQDVQFLHSLLFPVRGLFRSALGSQNRYRITRRRD